jgi:hypothetical protein
VPSVEVVGLSEHVDYWDHLGWRDPFSSPAYTTRQAEYAARVFHSGSTYTPQLVIDGQYEAVGSDVAAVRKAILRASNAPKALVRLSAAHKNAGRIDVHVQVVHQAGVVLRERGDIIVAVTQDGLADDVSRGENRGRRLVHSAVVRSLTALGSVAGPEPAFTSSTSLPIDPTWNMSDLRVIALLQEHGSRRILGAGSVVLTPVSYQH